jgi:hypothetical protein
MADSHMLEGNTRIAGVKVWNAAIPTICGTKFFGHHIAALLV